MSGAATRIVLASASPQRRTLIERLGMEYSIEPSRFDEAGPGPDPHERVRANALGKAREVAERLQIEDGVVVLGCDTEVALDGITLGQPANPDEALRMILSLSGRAHEVVSGVALVSTSGERTHVETVEVNMRPVEPGLASWYVATGEWEGRAGAYAIQGCGAVLVDGIRGDYFSVVGFPVAAIGRMLETMGHAAWCKSNNA